MSEYENAYTNIKQVSSRDNIEKLNKTFPRFQRDNWLNEYISKRAAADKINSNNLSAIVEVLDNIIFPEYKVEPIVLSPIYRASLNSRDARVKDTYSDIREHVNNLTVIEPSIFGKGIVENPNSTARYNNEYYSPMNYENPSYANFLLNIYSGLINACNDQKQYAYTPIQTVLNQFETHFNDLKELGHLDLKKLVDNGYVSIVQDVYNKNSQNAKFQKVMNDVTDIMKNLKSKGFDIYRKESLSTINDFIKNDNVHNLVKFTEYFDRNILILNLNLRLEKN